MYEYTKKGCILDGDKQTSINFKNKNTDSSFADMRRNDVWNTGKCGRHGKTQQSQPPAFEGNDGNTQDKKHKQKSYMGQYR